MVCDVCMDVAFTDHGVPLSGLPMLLQRYWDQMRGEGTDIEHRRVFPPRGNGEVEVARWSPPAKPTHDTTELGRVGADERNTEAAAAADSGIRHVRSQSETHTTEIVYVSDTRSHEPRQPK